MAAAERIYRWTDEDGTVHYSDKIPPDKVDRGHTRITDTGIAVESVPPTKTLEERLREEELERLRIQQQRLIEQQAEADKVLLRTYRSPDDLVMAREGKLAGIDALIGVARNHIRRQQEWLMDLYAEAADLERAGKPVPEHVRDSIQKSEATIREAYAGIIEQEQQKQDIREAFDRDLKRYRQLAGLPDDRMPARTLGASETFDRESIPNLVTCSDRTRCDALWRLARDFVGQQATTPIRMTRDNLIVTATPRKPDEIGLILSRIRDREGDGAVLFLDVQCQARRGDSQECLDPRAAVLLRSFREALGRTPASHATPSTQSPPADQGADTFIGKQVQQ